MSKLLIEEKERIIREEYPFADKEELAKRLGYKNASTLRTVASKLGISSFYTIPDLQGEEWRTHEDFPDYLFSNMGRIKSKFKNSLIKQRVHEGYYDFRIKGYKGKKKSGRTHRVVAELFVINKEPEICNIVNHKDANKLNNCYLNLEWTTAKGNVKHALENVEFKWNANNRLKEHEVIDICEKLSEGLSIRDIVNGNPRYTRGRVEKIRQRVRHTEISKKYTWEVY